MMCPPNEHASGSSAHSVIVRCRMRRICRMCRALYRHWRREVTPTVNLDDFTKARLADLIYDVRTWGLREEPGRDPIEVVPGQGLLRLRARFVVPPPATVPHDVYIDVTEVWQP